MSSESATLDQVLKDTISAVASGANVVDEEKRRENEEKRMNIMEARQRRIDALKMAEHIIIQNNSVKPVSEEYDVTAESIIDFADKLVKYIETDVD